MMQKLVPVGIVLWLVFMTETRADAYLDPGSGSMLVQLLLGGVAGAAVIVKLGWQRFRDLLRFRSETSKPHQTKPNE
jgi:hypothetical protein